MKEGFKSLVMKQLFFIIIAITIPSFAITSNELENLEPVLYHPITYNAEGYPDGYQGDPEGFYPIGLQDDSLFYYIETSPGGCCSEADISGLTLYQQNLKTDKLTVVASFSIETETVPEDSPLRNTVTCDDTYKVLIQLAPKSFIEKVTSLKNLNRSYVFTSEKTDDITFKFQLDDGSQIKPVMTISNRSRTPLKNALLIAESPLGTKQIARFDNVPNLPSSAAGEVSGILSFEGSSRAIVVIGYTISWFDPFVTIGCHVTKGFEKKRKEL